MTMGEMDNMTTVLEEYSRKHPPARTTVQAYMDNLVKVRATQSDKIPLLSLGMVEAVL